MHLISFFHSNLSSLLTFDKETNTIYKFFDTKWIAYKLQQDTELPTNIFLICKSHDYSNIFFILTLNLRFHKLNLSTGQIKEYDGKIKQINGQLFLFKNLLLSSTIEMMTHYNSQLWLFFKEKVMIYDYEQQTLELKWVYSTRKFTTFHKVKNTIYALCALKNPQFERGSFGLTCYTQFSKSTLFCKFNLKTNEWTERSIPAIDALVPTLDAKYFISQRYIFNPKTNKYLKIESSFNFNYWQCVTQQEHDYRSKRLGILLNYWSETRIPFEVQFIIYKFYESIYKIRLFKISQWLKCIIDFEEVDLFELVQ